MKDQLVFNNNFWYSKYKTTTK